MGNLSNNTLQQNEQNMNLRIDIDFEKNVLDELQPLINWSLSQIRQIYVPFRKRKGSPIMSRSEFLRFIGLSRISSFHIFNKMSEIADVNVFQVLSILTLTAYAHVNNKVQFLFNVFDLQGNKLIQFKQLVLLFTSLIRGFGIMTGQKLPQHTNIQKYAQTLFSKADLNNDQNLQLGEVLGWFESHVDGTKLFNRFQPSVLGKQCYHIFNGFPAYKQTQIDIIFQRLNKVYHKQELNPQDYKLLTAIRKSVKNSNLQKQNYFSESMYYSSFNKYASKLRLFDQSGRSNKTIHENSNLQWTNNLKIQDKHKMPSIGLKKQASSSNNQLQKFPIKQNKSSYINKSLHNSAQFSQKENHFKKKFNNIIIIKGKTITKKQIFDLRDYFDKISSGKKVILIEDFLESFNQQKYNHMKSVAASLYNFLDKNQNGKVSFIEFIRRLYPALNRDQLNLIQNWSQEYNCKFNMDKKIKANRQQQQHKKRVLPKSCVNRFKQIYHLFDVNGKGYVTYQDLKRVLSEVSTEKQLLETFQDCDRDKDGRLSLQEFSHILLPPDLEIEGLL